MAREKKTVPVYGKLRVLDGPENTWAYTLLAPRPVGDFDDWINKDERVFYVVDDMLLLQVPRFIVVRGNYIIDLQRTRNTIEVETEAPETNEVIGTPV